MAVVKIQSCGLPCLVDTSNNTLTPFENEALATEALDLINDMPVDLQSTLFQVVAMSGAGVYDCNKDDLTELARLEAGEAGK